MIYTKGLTRAFDDKVAVHDLDLEVKDGEVFGFIGPNGAGKTTTVRMLCCLIRPTSGEAFIDEWKVGKEPDMTNIRRIIGLLPEVPGLHDSLTAHQVLDFYGKLYKVETTKRERNIKRLLKMLDIWDQRDKMVGTFSKGMRQKVAITRALVHEPKFIFLDEPTAALDPVAAKTVRDFILKLKKEGSTIFITTHNLAEAERVCDRVAIFNSRLIDIGSPTELARRYFTRRTIIHLGGKDDGSWKGLPGIIEGLDGVARASMEGDRLVAHIDHPETTNPRVIAKLISQGAKVKLVNEETFTLEDVYLKLMGKPIEENGEEKVEPEEKKGGRKTLFSLMRKGGS